MTAARYNATNNKEIAITRASAPTAPGAARKGGSMGVIPAHAHPASVEATTYFQIAASTGVTPNCMGFPAYQNAGIVRIQKDAVQPTAIPTGPHGSATKNSRTVKANSTIPQRNQRSGFPMERWIQPWVP